MSEEAIEMAKGKKDARTMVAQKCSNCGVLSRRHIEKNNVNTPDKMEMKRYCPRCKSHQVFKEAKIGK